MGRGLLVFKGDDKKAKKKKSKSKHRKSSTEEPSETTVAVAVMKSKPPQQEPDEPQSTTKTTTSIETPKIQNGTGQITTSGTVVAGHETRFTRELSVGDAILVKLQDEQEQEMRVVTMRLSDVSLNLSSPFSQDIRIPTSFQYIHKPRDVQREAQLAHQEAIQNAKQEEQQAFGTYYTDKKDDLVYREKTTHGSYRIKKVQVQGSKQPLTRGDLLELRSKKKSDKYC